MKSKSSKRKTSKPVAEQFVPAGQLIELRCADIAKVAHLVQQHRLFVADGMNAANGPVVSSFWHDELEFCDRALAALGGKRS